METKLAPHTEMNLGNLASHFDLDVNNVKLLQRWSANRAFRESGEERILAKVLLRFSEVHNSFRKFLVRAGKEDIPKCFVAGARLVFKRNSFILISAFPDEDTWDTFLAELLSVFSQHYQKLSGWISLRGSSVTFLSMHPEKGRDPEVNTKRPTVKPSEWKAQLHFFDSKVSNSGCRTLYLDCSTRWPFSSKEEPF